MDFTVGCEIEVTLELLAVVAAQGPCVTNLVEFAEYVVSRYERVRARDDIAMQSDIDGISSAENHWNLTDDVTIETSSPKQWPIEVVSPVMFHRPDGEWMSQIMALFKNLNRVCRVETNQSCGFHVHFAPVGGWDIDTLKALSRAILFFEPAFEVLLPIERRGNEYARSNRIDNPRLSKKSGMELFQIIDQCTHPVHVADLLNDGGNRYYGWNFVNLYYGRIQTVEFRRGPGVCTIGPCIAWIELIIRFAQAALGVTTTKLLGQKDDVAGLWKFIIENSPAADSEIPRPLFHGKSGSLGPRLIRDLAPEEQEKLARKQAEAEKKNFISMKMRLLFAE
ncbi:hypothetical protein P168DRAFT_305046 [Aspergillus campestris IBT 28561]|uniref:Amidoligase enzyme n=1 Tax=Aspergillus campestris (strain IBT 28561) TaxID=1392248 RepID=A0A2I1D1G1_ASPC2|nr:uncharacterized protein P168DRAFT_305046 [Aspergillus campestris IBT 28561]PKY03710.1 hypothetical protein P168DRAFT_305046 [Aspergillus campestris IBT 28561]